MVIKPVSEMLAPAGLCEPLLNALVPNETNYKVLLMQPQGNIEGSAAGVWNKDRALAARQFGMFLNDARESQADLVITPEYSMPWNVLVEVIKSGLVPAQGKLWALGCESIKYQELETLKQDIIQFATLLFEPLPPDAERFTDPLAYVFLAPAIEATVDQNIVVLVQFKTFPMGDDDHFEINGLQRGTCLYQFNSGGPGIKLTSMLCSDALAFSDANALAVYDRGLVVHIQLNPKPRQTQYRQYRDKLFRFGGNATELICLNWAGKVHEWCGDVSKPWNNISGSAWYLQPIEFDERDATLCANHQRGLYYTWFDALRSHALFFNYEPATFLLEASKVVHIGVTGSVSRRRGPQLLKMSTWDVVTSAWVEQAYADDGFSTIIEECGEAKEEIKRIADANPFNAERILALCAGEIGSSEDWYKLPRLDSCSIDTSEIICRLTFCQDTETHAHAFRVMRLRRLRSLWSILKSVGELPQAIMDFNDGFQLAWSLDFLHQNAISATGQRATVVYMGEEFGIAHVEKTKKRIADYLHRSSSGIDESLSARQRLTVWFRDDEGKVVPFEPHCYIKIDQTGKSTEFDLGRET